MWFTNVNFARERGDRPSASTGENGTRRRRTRRRVKRNDHARVAPSGRSQNARACHLPAPSMHAPVGTELVRGEHLDSST